MTAFARGIAMGLAMVVWFLQVLLSWSISYQPSRPSLVWWVGIPIAGLAAIIYLMRRPSQRLAPYALLAIGLAIGAVLTLTGAAMASQIAG
jgi:hypothetical protein